MQRLPFGKTIKMPCMRKGLCEYPDSRILLGQKVLEDLSKTAHGIPVVIEHPDMPIDEKSMAHVPIHGRVTNMEYNSTSDEWEANFVVDTQEAIDLLKKGHGVSTAWYGTKYGPGGTMNNVPYDKELQAGEYEHLAIVSQPRYEMARNPIFMNSAGTPCKTAAVPAIIESKQSLPLTGSKPMLFGLWRNKREEIKLNEGEEAMVNVGGEDKRLCDLVEEYKKKKSAESAPPAQAEPKANMMAETDEVEVDGEKMTIKQLMDYVSGGRQDAGAEPEGFAEEDKGDAAGVAKAVDSKEEASKDDEEEGGDAKKEDDKKDEKAKANSNFNDMAARHENAGGDAQPEYVSTRERMEMGRVRYGSAK